MSDDGKCTCPQTRRVFSQRKMLAKWQRDPRWKKMKEEHAWIPEARCVYCGRSHGQIWNGKPVQLTINHASRHLYLSEELYLTWDPRYMEITCLSCNRAYERGQKPCPECLKNGKITYILDRETECNSCYLKKNPDKLIEAEQSRQSFKTAVKQANANRAERQRKAKVYHPCTHHRIGGWCGLSAIHSQCQYSKTKALKPAPVGCSEAIAKKRMVKA